MDGIQFARFSLFQGNKKTKLPLYMNRLVGFCFVPLVLLLCIAATSAFAKDDNWVTASFDWSMPDRTIDSDSDNLIDSYRKEPVDIAPPEEGWQVAFNACASASEFGYIMEYAWYINGVHAGDTHLCGAFSYNFPEEGTYEVKLVATDNFGNTGETTRFVPVQDWLIVAIGDSYGSGEGNPDYPMSDESFSESQDALITLGDQINTLKSASDDLKQKVNTLDQRLYDLQQAEFDLDAVLSELQPLETAFNEWITCDSIDACATATANLITKLFEAGIDGAEALLTQGVSAVRAKIDALSAAARAAVEVAESAVTAASTGVATAETAFETAETAVADAVAYWNSTHPDDPFPGHDVIYPGNLDPLGGLSWPAAVWKDGRCNRSAYSGQAKAALEVEKADPRTSVTFLHLACSGATIADGLVGPYNGPGYEANVDDESVDDPSDCDPETEVYVENDYGNTYCMLKPQVQRLSEMTGNREIDALLVSIGGNDVYFAPIVKACIMQEPCFAEDFYGTDLGATYLGQIAPLVTALCDPLYPLQPFWDPAGGEVVYYACNDFFSGLVDIVSAGDLIDYIDPLLPEKIMGVAEDVCPVLGTLAELSAQCRSFFDDLESQVYEDINGEPSLLKTAYQLSEAGFSTLQDEYESLSETLFSFLPDFNQEWLFITEYGNAARDENEELCYFDWTYPLRGLPLGSLDEMQWVEQSMIQRLDEHIASLGNDGHENNLGWNPVSGIYAAATPHGYCAEENWVHRIQNSFMRQGEILGAVHPTPAAHESIGEQIYSEVINKLYINGDLLEPRLPQQPPVADTGGPYVIDEGAEQVVTHGTFDYNNDTITYSWLLTPSEPWNLTFDNSILEFPTLIAKDDYAGTLILAASDNDGSSTASTTVTVKNVAPAITDMTIYEANEGQPATLTVSFTDPGAADTHTADIDWEDGNISNLSAATGPGTFEAQHAYCDDGIFDITVLVTDDDGGFAKAVIPVKIYNMAPIIDPIGDRTVAEGIRMTGAVTYSDAGTCDTHSSTVSYGDGSPFESPAVGGGSVPLDHVYADNGEYKVEVCVQDDDGAASCQYFMVTVTNQVPTVAAGTDKNVAEGYEISTDTVQFNDPGTLDTHTAAIDWGEGPPATAGVVSEAPYGPPGSIAGLDGQVTFGPYVYADNGSYTATVCVTDDDGGTGCDPVTVTVTNVAPTIDSISVGSGQDFFLPLVSIPLQFDFNDKGTLDTHSATIEWADGAVNAAAIYESPSLPGSTAGADGTGTGSHAYSAAGMYTVAISLEDDDGGAATAYITVEVIDPVQATERAIASLAEAAANPEIDPYDSNLLQEALKDLEGTLQGKPNSGALDKILDGDFPAALLKIAEALEDLEQILGSYGDFDLELLKLVLTQIAESIAADLLGQAEAAIDWTSPGAVMQINKLSEKFLEGQTAKDAGDYILAVEKFHDVTKRAEQLLP